MSTRTRFEKEAKGNSEMAYLLPGYIVGAGGFVKCDAVSVVWLKKGHHQSIESDSSESFLCYNSKMVH